MLKKADIILATIILIAGITASLVIGSFSPAKGEKAFVISDGHVFGVYSLYENRTVTVLSNGHVNKILIRGGEARMISSNCSGKDCIHQGSTRIQYIINQNQRFIAVLFRFKRSGHRIEHIGLINFHIA